MERIFAKPRSEYHRLPTPGRFSRSPDQGLTNQRDLALAYSPALRRPAMPSSRIPATRRRLRRGPTWSASSPMAPAVLGLGNIGPWPPSRSWKQGCLFQNSPASTSSTSNWRKTTGQADRRIAAMEPTLGGVNLEDIRLRNASTSRQSSRNG